MELLFKIRRLETELSTDYLILPVGNPTKLEINGRCLSQLGALDLMGTQLTI